MLYPHFILDSATESEYCDLKYFYEAYIFYFFTSGHNNAFKNSCNCVLVATLCTGTHECFIAVIDFKLLSDVFHRSYNWWKNHIKLSFSVKQK